MYTVFIRIIKMKKTALILIFLCLILYTEYFILQKPSAFAGPTSTNFQLLQYGFGAGGVASASSDNYLFQGILGEIETASLSSTNYMALPGLTYTLQPNTPDAPTFTNPSNYYNKLHLTINNANNSTDTTFAIKVSSGSATFSSTQYFVQADHTLGLSPVWQTYASWGSGTGFDLIGLFPGTTYYAKVAAKRGVFTQGPYGPVANAATINPTLTFDLSTTSQPDPPFSVNIGNLTPGSVTTSTDKITSTISTNATNGGLIYLYGTNNGLKSATAGNHNIASVSYDLSSGLMPEGYGARGTTVTQGSGGPMELVSPYNGVGENVGIIDTAKRTLADSTSAPVTGGQTTFELKAKASSTTPSANDYTDILTIIATGSF